MGRKSVAAGEALPKGFPMVYVWAILLVAVVGCMVGSYGSYGKL